MTEEASYLSLLNTLHPKGLCCPNGHSLPSSQQPYRHTRAPVVDYRCKQCKKVFNIFTGTAWAGTHYSCDQVVLIVDGFNKGMPITAVSISKSYLYKLIRVIYITDGIIRCNRFYRTSYCLLKCFRSARLLPPNGLLAF